MELKKIIHYLLFFTLLFIGINYILSKGLSYLYEHNLNGQSGGKINYFMNMSPHPEVLVMGNSRSLYQIIPDSFSYTSFYNLSHAGMDDCYQLGLLHYIVKMKKKPNILLLQIDPEFYINNTKHFVSKDIQHLKYYYDKDELIQEEINNIGMYEKLKNAIPLYKYNGRTISLLKNYKTTKTNAIDNNRGFVKIIPSKFDSLNTVISYNSRAPLVSKKFSIDKAKYLLKIIEICKNNDIRLICFTSPHYKYDISEYQIIDDNLNTIFSKHNITYYNMDIDTTLTNKIKSPIYWKDYMHVNLYGASIVSLNFNKKLIQLNATDAGQN